MARVIDLLAVGQRHGGMQFGEIDDHIRWMIVGGTFEMRFESGSQDPDPGVLDRDLLIRGLELDGIELDWPALGFGRSRFQFHQHELHGVAGPIIPGVLARREPGDLPGLVVGKIGKVYGDRVGMLALWRLLVGSLFHAQDANPSVIDFDCALCPGESRRREDRQTESWNHTCDNRG